MKGQWWTNNGRGEKEVVEGGGMNQELQTVGCVITHRFNNSPPSTKAAWLQGREGGKKRKENSHMLMVIFREDHNILNRVILSLFLLVTSSAVGP